MKKRDIIWQKKKRPNNDVDQDGGVSGDDDSTSSSCSSSSSSEEDTVPIAFIHKSMNKTADRRKNNSKYLKDNNYKVTSNSDRDNKINNKLVFTTTCVLLHIMVPKAKTKLYPYYLLVTYTAEHKS